MKIRSSKTLYFDIPRVVHPTYPSHDVSQHVGCSRKYIFPGERKNRTNSCSDELTFFRRYRSKKQPTKDTVRRLFINKDIWAVLSGMSRPAPASMPMCMSGWTLFNPRPDDNRCLIRALMFAFRATHPNHVDGMVKHLLDAQWGSASDEKRHLERREFMSQDAIPVVFSVVKDLLARKVYADDQYRVPRSVLLVQHRNMTHLNFVARYYADGQLYHPNIDNVQWTNLSGASCPILLCNGTHFMCLRYIDDDYEVESDMDLSE